MWRKSSSGIAQMRNDGDLTKYVYKKDLSISESFKDDLSIKRPKPIMPQEPQDPLSGNDKPLLYPYISGRILPL